MWWAFDLLWLEDLWWPEPLELCELEDEDVEVVEDGIVGDGACRDSGRMILMGRVAERANGHDGKAGGGGRRARLA